MKPLNHTLRVTMLSFALVLLGITHAAAQGELPRLFTLRDIGAKGTCNCYFSTDCSSTQYCSYNGCTKSGKFDGTCTRRSTGGFSDSVFPLAIDFYFEAFIASAKGEGGIPDVEAVRRAQDQRLTTDEHFAVQSIVHNALDLALGFDFIGPQPSCIGSDEDGQLDPGGLGQILFAAKDALPEEIELAEIVHRGVVEAITANNPDVVAKPIRLFWEKHPQYQPRHTGRCFPHGHPEFPYKTAEECQIEELKHMLALFLLPVD